jgi:hypothetical protein
LHCHELAWLRWICLRLGRRIEELLMKRFIYSLLLLAAFATTTLAGDSTQVLKRIDQLEGAYASKSSIKVGLFEESTKGYATYADAAGPTPVNGTGGAPTVTFTRSTSSPLEGKASGLLTKDAANRQGEGFSYDFTLDSAYTVTPQNMVIEFFYESGGTFVSGSSSDVRVYIYDVTNSNLITPQNVNIGGSSGRFQTTFLPVSSSSNYRLIFHIATTSAAAWTLKVDKISIHELPTTYNTSGVSSVALLTTGNGFGSTNTNIRRYTAITTQGSALTCADSATLGTSCTVNESGLYTANRLDRNTGAASNFGITKNDDCTTGGFNSVASADQVAYTMAASNTAVNASTAGIALSEGDVIRACDDSAAKTNDTSDRTSRLSIAKVRDEALPSAYIVATGGTITTDGNYRIHTFTSSGTFQITAGSGSVEYLVVGGGGAGGSFGHGGGGGAGGVAQGNAVYGTGSYTVTVGAGGTGGVNPTTNGAASVFDVISAAGGGHGGGTNEAGTAGGSGGGAGAWTGGGALAGGTASAGNAGGASNTSGAGANPGAGGGGCGGAGTSPAADGSTAGNGGAGCVSSITGAAVTYACGGGGGANSGGGGTGGCASAGNGAATGVAGGGAGTANTGGGGGGSGNGATLGGGNGGSGIVILRYQFQ